MSKAILSVIQADREYVENSLGNGPRSEADCEQVRSIKAKFPHRHTDIIDWKRQRELQLKQLEELEAQYVD